MRFAEIDVFGVYVAPISLLMLVAWILTVALRWISNQFGLLDRVWHPALFVFSVYTIILSSIVLTMAR